MLLTNGLLAGPNIKRDLIWNYTAFGVMGLSGISINLIIATRYGADGVGAFNQVYAFYIVAAQFAILGLQHSTLKHAAEHAFDQQQIRTIVWTAACLAFLVGAVFGGLGIVAAPRLGRFIDSSAVGSALGQAALALPFFSINKVLLAALNGLRLMVRFAAWQITRYVILVLAVLALVLSDRPVGEFGLVFVATELPLSIALIAASAHQFGLPILRTGSGWIKRHINFGIRGFLGGILMELNVRVDVIMLGIFASDAMVGIYSFAAMLVEAFLELLGILRIIVSPILVPMLKQCQFGAIDSFAKTVQRRLYPASLAMAGLIVVCYPFAITLLFGDGSAFTRGWEPLLILSAGVFIVSGFIPFDTMLMQAGRPGSQTILVLAVVATNVALNGVLIPTFGMLGAAIATAATLALSVVYLNFATRISLGHSIGFPIFSSSEAA